MNSQHGLFANINGKHSVSEVGREKKKNRHEIFHCKKYFRK